MGINRCRAYIKFALLLLILAAASFFFLTKDNGQNTEAQSDMQAAFSGRKWGLMDSLYRDSVQGTSAHKSLTSRDISLYVNALWIQGRYGEVTDILGNEERHFPKELEPYANMLLMLGLERTGRSDEAYKVGRSIEVDSTGPLKYYIYYALGRLSRELSLDDEAIAWFRMMYDCAPDRSRRVQALRQIVTVPGAKTSEAAQLLLESPSEASALAKCLAVTAGSNAEVDYAVGYHEYAAGRYADAISRFELVSDDCTYGEAAKFYYAYSAYRRKSDDIALEVWAQLALEGKRYSKRAVQRLTALAARSATPKVLEVLSSVAESRAASHDISAEALVGILKLGDKKEAQQAWSDLIQKHPASTQAVNARWHEGWRAWKSGEYAEAAEQWTAALSQGAARGESEARLMYWSYRALLVLNRSDDAAAVKSSLVKSYPSEYYTFLVDSTGGIVEKPIPESYVKPSLAELWGFLTYARMGATVATSAKRDIATLFSAVRLALADGDFASALRSFDVLRRAITGGERSSAELLRCVFPRVFEREVMEASSRTGVEPAIIWGIMRQESLFETNVTSPVGAYGLMQLMPGTAKGEAEKMKMPPDSYKQQASSNILLGASYIGAMISKFGDLPRALAAYNAGASPVGRWSRRPVTDIAEWVEEIEYDETRGYVKAVMRNIQAYRLLYPDDSVAGKSDSR